MRKILVRKQNADAVQKVNIDRPLIKGTAKKETGLSNILKNMLLIHEMNRRMLR